jgi:hypothetical protein
MARTYVMTAKRKAQQKLLNQQARNAVLELSKFQKQMIRPLRPMMWEFDWKVLDSAIRLVRQELWNQTLTLK